MIDYFSAEVKLLVKKPGGTKTVTVGGDGPNLLQIYPLGRRAAITTQIDTIVAAELSHSDVLCKLKDNGNGYYVKTKSYSCTEPDHIFNLDYSEIEYIYMAYKALKKKEKKNAPKD